MNDMELAVYITKFPSIRHITRGNEPWRQAVASVPVSPLFPSWARGTIRRASHNGNRTLTSAISDSSQHFPPETSPLSPGAVVVCARVGVVVGPESTHV